MQTVLYCEANKNQVVATSFGMIKFDEKGYAEADVSADDMQLVRNLKWLMDDTVSKDELIANKKQQLADLDKARDALSKQIDDLVAQADDDAKKMAKVSGKAKAPTPEQVKADDEAKKLAEEQAKMEAEAKAKADEEAHVIDASGQKKQRNK